MKNYQISPGQIPHLVRLTADLFREMNEEIDPVLRPGHMHFVADLLKDLVDTAYPIEEEKKNNNQRPYKISIPVIEDAELMADVIIEAIKMAEEQCFRDGEF